MVDISDVPFSIPRAYFVCNVVVDTHYGGCDDARIWGRIIGHPNGMLSVEPDRS